MQTSSRNGQRGFSLLELIMVITVSAAMIVVISLFLKTSLSSARMGTEEAELAHRIKFAISRLRRSVRHSISALSNWQLEVPAYAARTFEATETLFFITNSDSDAVAARELHFVWFERTVTFPNGNGTGRLIHCWQEANSIPGFLQPLVVPPNMSGGAFGYLPLLTYLRDRTLFNFGNKPTLGAGWEILLDCTGNANLGQLPVRIARRQFPIVTNVPQSLPVPFGLHFGTRNPIEVRQTAPTQWRFLAANPIDNRLTIGTAAVTPGLPAVVGGAPYPVPLFATVPATGLQEGRLSCQLYLCLYVDSNNDGLLTPGETYLPILTSLNPLLIPSAG